MINASRTVLLVDDEALFRRSLADGLAPLGDEHRFVIRTAQNGEEAKAILEREPVHLMLTDLRMPGCDGLQLLAWMISTRRTVPTAVMTAVPSADAQMILRECGVFTVLQKPVDLEAVQQLVVSELSAKRAKLEGIELIAYLQLLAMERSTALVTIRSRGRVGWMQLAQGALAAAGFEGLEGVDAAYAMLDLPDVIIEMVEKPPTVSATLRIPLSGVIMEAMRLRDERERGLVAPSSRPPGPAAANDGDEIDFEQEIARSARANAEGYDPSRARRISDSAPSLIRVPPLEALRAPAVPTGVSDGRARVAFDAFVERSVQGLIAGALSNARSQQLVSSFGDALRHADSFERIAQTIRSEFAKANLPAMHRYFIVDLEQRQFAVVVAIEAYQCALLFDKDETSLGMVLSIVIPELVRSLSPAISQTG